jgi:cytoskeletal protein RodZ
MTHHYNDPLTPMDPLDRRPRYADENGVQADPALHDGRASGSRSAVVALAVLAVLGILFWGMSAGNRTDTALNTGNVPPATQSSERPLTSNPSDRPATSPTTASRTDANQQGATGTASPGVNAPTANTTSENTGTAPRNQ